jgi:undecaprenyl-diphosphatase
MTFLEAIILGIVQGATEFLPISSSGHLVLGQYLLGLDEPQLLFDIVLHVGTLLAVIGFYRRDLGKIVEGLRRSALRLLDRRPLAEALEPEGARLALLIVIASVPTALLGILVDEYLPVDRGTRLSALFVCGALLVNGCILFAGRFARDLEPEEREGASTLWNIAPWVALVIGIAQGAAVIPGLSRSGLTIITALFLGVWRDQAARYSFLMSVPAILGALVLKFEPAAFSGTALSTNLPIFLLGALSAGLVGYGAIILLVKLIERAQFHHFSWYCWAIGAAGLFQLL